MRIIKFRAFDVNQNKIFFPSIINFEIGSLFDPNKGPEEHINFDDFPIMQFTGLHDKNGKEIYEGDILEIEGATAKVVFWERPPEFGLDYDHNEDAWCEDWSLSDDCEQMEIVGNIYQNPNILSAI